MRHKLFEKPVFYWLYLGEIHEGIVCEHKEIVADPNIPMEATGKLSCPTGQIISVLEAFYGRVNGGTQCVGETFASHSTVCGPDGKYGRDLTGKAKKQ